MVVPFAATALCHSRRRRRLGRHGRAPTARAAAAGEAPSYAVSPQNGNPHRCTLVYLHGWTGTAEDYLCRDSHTEDFCLPWRLGDTYAPGLRVLLPAAPLLPQPWGEELPSWYSYVSGDSNEVGDKSTLEATRDRLSYFVRSEIELLGGDSRRLFVGGMSQGCTAALDLYLREAAALQLGGFVGSVGFVPSDAMGFDGTDEALETLIGDADQARRPFWLNCAVEDDEEVPWTLVQASLQRLRGRLPGLIVQKLRGVRHDIGEWEAFILSTFLENFAPDAYGEDMREVVAEEDFEDWDEDMEIDLDIGPDIPGMYA